MKILKAYILRKLLYFRLRLKVRNPFFNILPGMQHKTEHLETSNWWPLIHFEDGISLAGEFMVKIRELDTMTIIQHYKKQKQQQQNKQKRILKYLDQFGLNFNSDLGQFGP